MFASLNSLTLSILGLASGHANLDIQPAIDLANLDNLPQIELAADLLDTRLGELRLGGNELLDSNLSLDLGALDLSGSLNTLNGLELALLLNPGLSA
jgi:hypothetical protein